MVRRWSGKWAKRLADAGASGSVSESAHPETTVATPEEPSEPVVVRQPSFGAGVMGFVPAPEPAITYYPRRVGGGMTDVQVLERAWQERRHLVIYGKPGTGKSTAPWVLAQRLGLPIVRLSMDVAKDPSKIIGQWVPCSGEGCDHQRKGKGFCFQAAPALKMYEQGGVLVVEELNAVSQGVAFTLHPMLDDIDQMVVDDLGVVAKRHPDFWCVGTMNPSDDAGALGTQQVNYALWDRFKCKLYFDYDPAIEARLVKNDERILKIRDRLRNGNLRTEVTTRMLRDMWVNVGIFGWEVAKLMFGANFPAAERELVLETCKLIGG